VKLLANKRQAADDPTCLVPVKASIFFEFVTEDPLAADYVSTMGTGNELPRVIGEQGIKLGLHRLVPVGILERLIHRARDGRDGRLGCCRGIAGVGLERPHTRPGHHGVSGLRGGRGW